MVLLDVGCFVVSLREVGCTRLKLREKICIRKLSVYGG